MHHPPLKIWTWLKGPTAQALLGLCLRIAVLLASYGLAYVIFPSQQFVCNGMVGRTDWAVLQNVLFILTLAHAFYFFVNSRLCLPSYSFKNISTYAWGLLMCGYAVIAYPGFLGEDIFYCAVAFVLFDLLKDKAAPLSWRVRGVFCMVVTLCAYGAVMFRLGHINHMQRVLPACMALFMAGWVVQKRRRKPAQQKLEKLREGTL